MKIIGTLDTKDDGDILLEVLEQADGLFDAVYAYNDGSIDNTNNILQGHPVISKLWHRDDFSDEERGRYLQHRRGWLLEQVKKDFPYETEDTWVVRLEGDRFFLNQEPAEIVDRAVHAEMDSRCGVMLDFRRHRAEGWGDADTWPDWHMSIRELQRWFTVDDIHNVVAFKVTDDIDYAGAVRPRPWPRGCKPNDLNIGRLSKDMVFFEHHGRRSPNYFHWTIESGSRPLSIKHQKRNPHYNYTSPETIYNCMVDRFQPYKVWPYTDFDQAIDHIIWLNDNTEFGCPWMMGRPWAHTETPKNKAYQDAYFLGIEQTYYQSNKTLPLRVDL